MSIEIILSGLVFLFLFIILLVLLSNSKRPYLTTLVCAGSGIGALILVSFLSTYTGVGLGINFLTSGISVLLGIPGVITLLALKLIL